MSNRRSPLKRSAPPRKRRPGPPRRGQPTKAEKAAIRLQVYERCGGLCELNLMPGCLKGVLPFDGECANGGTWSTFTANGASAGQRHMAIG